MSDYYVEAGLLHRPDGSPVCKVGPRTGWHGWLADPTHAKFVYHNQTGQTMTVVKEPRTSTRSGLTFWYWIAYTKRQGKKRSKSLGSDPAGVTLHVLEKVCQDLNQLRMDAGA